jgi:haloacetate dehalogenase
MFESFSQIRIDTGEVEINLRKGGSGPPLLLLHGYPQNHIMWHGLAPVLAQNFTVICADLRGYGDSDKPLGAPDHANYSKRVMAADMVRVMEHLGYTRFRVAGHDRGGRVAHRLCLDWPYRVERAAVLDIIPTHKLFTTTNQLVSTGYYHWFFLIQPDGLPEHMIGLDPDYFLKETLARWSALKENFAPEALQAYLRSFRDPACIHATCEDYRAAATIDLEHDEADMAKKIDCPLLVLWGLRGLMHKSYDVPATWRERASDVTAKGIDCGHFLPEERPLETLDALANFFAE